MLDYEKTRNFNFADVRHSYTSRDSILYALGIGMGADPMNRKELPFVYEKNQVAMPTMACVLASSGFWLREVGIDVVRLVHGEQSVTMHGALPAAGTVIGRSRVTRIVDKGEGKGAVVYTEKKLFDEAADELIATLEQSMFCRGDGGFSKYSGVSDTPAPAFTAPPDRAVNLTIDLPTRPDAALLYRLSGDLNPLHADPAIAEKAGFPKPILHGLATFGITARGLLESICDYETSHLKSIRARMSSPVYSGETLRLECWKDEKAVAFQVKVVERGVTVLSHGHATFAH